MFLRGFLSCPCASIQLLIAWMSSEELRMLLGSNATPIGKPWFGGSGRAAWSIQVSVVEEFDGAFVLFERWG